jgi:TRAP-type mannitol/chloroaromatic compound transport system permease small subunit
VADARSGRAGFGALTAVLAAIGTGWILFLMALICADVLSRWLLNAPILGVAEMVQFSIVGIVFLQLPQTLRVGGLTRADVLFARIQSRAPRVACVMQLAYDLIGAALFAIILITTWPLAEQAFANREFYGSTGVVQIPTGPLKAIIILGCAALVVQFSLLAWRDLRIALGRARPAVSAVGD